MGRAEFEEEHPEVPLLSASQAGRVDLVMGAAGWLGDEEQVTTCTSLGGDSSTVIRVELQELRGGWRTAVLKQALPWLPRDESVAMPADRGGAEFRFYRRVARLPEAAVHMPRLLGGDEVRSLVLLEDFRGSRVLTSLYRGGLLSEDAADGLGSFLAALHCGTRGGQEPELANPGMKTLNHRLLFEAPFALSPAGETSFGADGLALDQAVLDDLEPGLGAAAAALRSDGGFRDGVAELGRCYLDGGPCLVHGAFSPGNWLLLPNGCVRVVDPQYGGWGDAEFDVGTGLAHLLLAQQDREVIRTFLIAASERVDGEAEESVAAPGLDRELVTRYVGVELARRLIGGGQLSLVADAGVRCALLDAARTAIVEGRLEALET